jgi:DNA-binding XRE family transcriptional regulator
MRISIFQLFVLLIPFSMLGLSLYLLILLIRALRKYLSGAPETEAVRALRGTLAERLREHRARCNMTQEFVAEALGVSRQAVSKWETGATDPSTANLIALAKLYGVPAQQLLEGL